MADPLQGAAGAVASVLQDAKAELPAPAEQLDLLVAENKPATERLRYDQVALAAESDRARKAGRPKGAQNLATQDLKRWLVALLGRTPQEWRIRWLMVQPEELAKRFGMTAKEALEFQDRIAKELQPYFMAAMQPVDEDGKPVPFFQLSFGGQVAGADGRAPWERSFERIEAEAVDVTPQERSP